MCLVGNNIYFIRCSFISGSNAQGCFFVLKSLRENVENITGNVLRTDPRGVQLTITNKNFPQFFNEVLAYDFENDNTIGTVPITKSINSVFVCTDAGI